MENKATTKTPIPTRSGFRNFVICTLIFAFSTYLSCHEFIATEPPFLSMDYFSVFSAFSVAISFVPPWLCGWQSIMQNKANVKMGNINISTANTKAYANEQRKMSNKRYSKQSQFKPNPSPKLELCSTLSEVEGPIKPNFPALYSSSANLAVALMPSINYPAPT